MYIIILLTDIYLIYDIVADLDIALFPNCFTFHTTEEILKIDLTKLFMQSRAL